MKKLLFIIIILFMLLGCANKKTKELANQVYSMEEDNIANKDERVKEITSEIRKLEKDLDATLDRYQKIGNFHRALGLKMMHYKMYLKAYEHFQKAIEFYPNSEMIHYYRGIAASQFAISQDVQSVKDDYLERARLSHEHSIKLNPGFVKGLYALSILYVYEFDRPNDAKELLDRLIQISTREFDAMLLRALLFEKDGEYNAALDIYDIVLSMSNNETHIMRADLNRDKVLKVISGE